MMDMSEVTQRMAALGVAKEGELVGVTEHEVRSLEERSGLTLPRAYKLFLLSMGRSAGYLSPWMAIYYDDLKEIREQFDCLNATLSTPAVLPANSLIIANWESVFDFMVCVGDDPAVMRVDLCHETGPQIKVYARSYSAYLNNLVSSANAQEIPSDLLESEPEPYAEDIISY